MITHKRKTMKKKLTKEYDTETDSVFFTKSGVLIKENLEVLYLSNNLITKIENLNENLKELGLRDNQIEVIENLNENLEGLYLSYNQIKVIENLNENLEVLHLSNNLITKIENLNENLKWLHLGGNPLKQITRKALEQIKKNKIRVYGVDVDGLEVVD